MQLDKKENDIKPGPETTKIFYSALTVSVLPLSAQLVEMNLFEGLFMDEWKEERVEEEKVRHPARFEPTISRLQWHDLASNSLRLN